MNIVLDTNALWSMPLIRELSAAREAGLVARGALEAILPTIAYAERWRQVRQRPDHQDAWQAIIDRVAPTLEVFAEAEALRLADRRPRGDAWRSHARDFLIAAHVYGDRVAVTRDGGPAWAQVPSLTPDQAAQAVRALVG